MLLMLNSIKCWFYSRLAVWKLEVSQPSFTVGYGYDIATTDE